MKKNLKTFVSVLMALIMVMSITVVSFAKSGLDENAYATVITASDFQDEETGAYDRFGNILTLMKNDGLGTPHSMLCGGDYSKVWPDYATPGVADVKEAYTSVYPDASEDSVVCIQGNHDFTSCGFTKTGYYDMGAYNLYVINENDFPWNQFLRLPLHIKNTANDLSDALDGLIAAGDKRPVIIMTHVPLHHTDRTFCGDNMYSSYLFNVINEKATNLDIVFIFGHNHSDEYDDYIGGAVNFMAPGEKIRIPLPDKMGEDCYTEETLNFTYTNCGYVGYSNNSDNEISTSTLTVSAIQFTEDTIHFVKYSENGLFRTYDVARKNCTTYVSNAEVKTEVYNSSLYFIMLRIFEIYENFIASFAK